MARRSGRSRAARPARSLGRRVRARRRGPPPGPVEPTASRARAGTARRATRQPCRTPPRSNSRAEPSRGGETPSGCGRGLSRLSGSDGRSGPGAARRHRFGLLDGHEGDRRKGRPPRMRLASCLGGGFMVGARQNGRRRRGEAGRPAGAKGRAPKAGRAMAPASDRMMSRARRTGCRQNRAATLPATRTISPPAAASASRLPVSHCQSISIAPFLRLGESHRPVPFRPFGSSTKVTSSVFPSGRESFRLAPSKPSAETGDGHLLVGQHAGCPVAAVILLVLDGLLLVPAAR